VLSRVKLIAEPWDAAPDGYRLGTLPSGWAQWNDRYRDGVRRFWRGDVGQAAELARRLSGSEDLFGASAGTPHASINFVACHDGFTLRDLVSYERKHNEANGEGNRDGHNDNLSVNFGVEGPADNPAVLAGRARMQRNFLLSLACSLGVPMIHAGDELGRTQRGNNNAYCHDSELTWVPWDTEHIQADVLEFTRRVFQLRRRFSLFGQGSFLTGRKAPGREHQDVAWLTGDGREMAVDDWHDPRRKLLGVLMHGVSLDTPATHAPSPSTAAVLLVFNAAQVDVCFRLPPGDNNVHWAKMADTTFVEQSVRPVYGNEIVVAGRSSIWLELLAGD
jgi:isoamylase